MEPAQKDSIISGNLQIPPFQKLKNIKIVRVWREKIIEFSLICEVQGEISRNMEKKVENIYSLIENMRGIRENVEIEYQVKKSSNRIRIYDTRRCRQKRFYYFGRLVVSGF